MPQHLDAAVPRRPFTDDVAGAIGRGIVEHEELEVRERLAQRPAPRSSIGSLYNAPLMGEFLRQAADLQIHAVEDGYVGRNVATNAVHHLNGTAALLLELCTGQMTADEVVAHVQKTFALAMRQLRGVRQAVDMLVDAGLVIRVPNTRARKAKPR